MTELLTLSEAADRLHIGKTRLWELTARGQIPTVRLPGGRIVRVRSEDLAAFVAAHTEGGPAANPEPPAPMARRRRR
jgi:excisionase family DNA binding protein